MTARSLRNIETRKKKASRKGKTPNITRSQGNTLAGRQGRKKAANLRRGRDAAAE